ncbi:MAG: hybrid sensor histidine kinase/response regulator, partial [Planctomycetia bacterium]
ARQLGKRVRFELVGENTPVDRDILDKLEAPIAHILRNGLDHGLETPEERVAAGKPEAAALRLEAVHQAGMLVLSMTDDGRGIDPERVRRKVVARKLATEEVAAKLCVDELLEFLFLPGFSTAESVTEVSGRGVGLDVVHSMAHAMGGSVEVKSVLGKGTEFRLKLPITLSVIRAVVVEIAGEPFAFPTNRVDRLLSVPRTDVREMENRVYFEWEGTAVGLVSAQQVLDMGSPAAESVDLCVLVVSDRAGAYGLAVDRFLGERELVVRPLDPRLGKVPDIHAAALIEDGSPLLIVDVEDMVRSIDGLLNEGRLRTNRLQVESDRSSARKRVLVVDDSITVREVERRLLENQGYEVDVAVDGMDGWNAVRAARYDLVVTDVDMPRMDGVSLVTAMRADANLHGLPVVVVSYKDREEDRLRGLEAGANHYLTKSSFHDNTFLKTVLDLIGAPKD